MNKEELLRIQTQAAEEGARLALKSIGLGDEVAISDIKELRNLLKAWQTAKTIMWQAIVKYITTFFLGALTLGILIKLKGALL